MKSKYQRGWFNESYRHYLAAKGVKTNRYMAKPRPKSPAVDRMIKDITGTDRKESIEKDVCVMCGRPADSFKNENSHREFTISGLCQECQDEVFFAKKKKDLTGLADRKNVTEKDVDKGELRRGIAIEMEHTKDERVAKEIALDHLAEIPDYYTRLEKMESRAKKRMYKAQRMVDFARVNEIKRFIKEHYKPEFDNKDVIRDHLIDRGVDKANVDVAFDELKKEGSL